MSKDSTPKDEDGNFILVGPPAEDGSARCVRHYSDHSFETGTVRPVKEGQEIHGEIIECSPREMGGFHVKSVHGGPPKVTTKAYREGWDSIFGKKQAVGEA